MVERGACTGAGPRLPERVRGGGLEHGEHINF